MLQYCKGSGSKVNDDKTVYMRFGKAMVLMDCFNFKCWTSGAMFKIYV